MSKKTSDLKVFRCYLKEISFPEINFRGFRGFSAKFAIFFYPRKIISQKLIFAKINLLKIMSNKKWILQIWCYQSSANYRIFHGWRQNEISWASAETGTISSYLSDILKEKMSASKKQVKSPSVRCIFGSYRYMLMVSECLCWYCVYVDVVAGITNESKMSH